ncbi:hypothetical protein QE152_g10307 [Popillia japonica]|uniref:Uncharacterized protein n=1 Tax=Popillia japonica TaxID=7064 RepID=A0AAW1LVP8_POPJA
MPTCKSGLCGSRYTSDVRILLRPELLQHERTLQLIHRRLRQQDHEDEDARQEPVQGTGESSDNCDQRHQLGGQIEAVYLDQAFHLFLSDIDDAGSIVKNISELNLVKEMNRKTSGKNDNDVYCEENVLCQYWV